jgi:hypothetical protein
LASSSGVLEAVPDSANGLLVSCASISCMGGGIEFS